MRMSRYFILASIVLASLVVVGVAYRTFVPGLSSARSEPPGLEVAVATWLLHHSVPEKERTVANPIGSDAADIAAGRDLFKQKCEICHAYDGSGKSEIGAGEYPRPPALHTIDVASMPDGEVFYHIRNGIRNTGMPAWSMPDPEIWQLVAFLRHLPRVVPSAQEPAPNAPTGTAHYVGSVACKNCHEETYARWSKTRMANVVRDPRERPDAIIPDSGGPVLR
jgi:mono/diheme cytochrome c family protein